MTPLPAARAARRRGAAVPGGRRRAGDLPARRGRPRRRGRPGPRPLRPDQRRRDPARRRAAGPTRARRGRRRGARRGPRACSPASGRTPPTLLRSAGWRVAVARADRSVAEVWAALGGAVRRPSAARPVASGPSGRRHERPPTSASAGGGRRWRRCWAPARSTPVFSSAPGCRRWSPSCSSSLAGGLLLRVGGPALWARLGPGGRCPAGWRRRRGRAGARSGQLLLVLCAAHRALRAGPRAVCGRAARPGPAWRELGDGARRRRRRDPRAGDARRCR